MLRAAFACHIGPKPASGTCAAAGSHEYRNGPEEDFGPASLRVRPGAVRFARHSPQLTEGTGALEFIKCDMPILSLVIAIR